MPDTINYGIIGCGMMGQEHIMNIQLLDNTRVAAICEPDAEMCAIARVMAPKARVYLDIDAFLKHPDLDCILLATPNYLHVPQLRQILDERPLPLLIEKPLFTDPADEAFIKGYGSALGHHAWVAMEYRYMPPIAAFIEQARDVTGGISMLTITEHRFPFLPKVGNWNRFNRTSGGTLVEKCCHFFDLMRHILGAEPVRVTASAGQAVNHFDEEYDEGRPDIWDSAYVIFDFDNGTRAMLELCMYAEGSRYQETVTAVGPEGKIECLVPGPGRFWDPAAGPAPTPKLITSPRSPKNPQITEIPVDPRILEAGDHNGSTFYQHQKFAQVVRGQRSPEVSLEDGWKAVAMGQAAQQAAREHRVVEIDWTY